MREEREQERVESGLFGRCPPPPATSTLAINYPFAAPTTLAFEILKVRHGTPVPQELLGLADRPADEHVCVRKLHTYSGEPFYHAGFTCPPPVFETLPGDTARNRKLLAAVLEEPGNHPSGTKPSH